MHSQVGLNFDTSMPFGSRHGVLHLSYSTHDATKMRHVVLDMPLLQGLGPFGNNHVNSDSESAVEHR